MTLDWRLLLAVALGGAAGSVARYLVSFWFVQPAPEAQIPYAILTVNVVGSFLIGLVFYLDAASMLSDTVRVGLAVGVMGGFTTFSSFSFDTLRLLQQGHHRAAMLNIALNVLLCLLAVWLGWLLGAALTASRAGNP